MITNFQNNLKTKSEILSLTSILVESSDTFASLWKF